MISEQFHCFQYKYHFVKPTGADRRSAEIRPDREQTSNCLHLASQDALSRCLELGWSGGGPLKSQFVSGCDRQAMPSPLPCQD